MKKIYGDRYEILSLIGEGGMACVYSAWDRKLDRKVALKLLHPQYANNPEIRERFYGEAKAISVLDHPNILRIYDFSGENSTESWLVTEILTGKTLADFIKEFPSGRVHPIIATCIIKEITKALIEAHSKKIVHRDIKPENIMILKNGQIKLMDFGIAKNLKKVSMTVTGTFMGSPSYMSPEQIKGIDVDHKTDLYSLGVVFYELLTGDVPYKGASTHEVLFKITQGNLVPPNKIVPSIPEDLNSMVVKLMAKDPDDRYKKAKNFALDLDTFLVLNGFAESNIELERYFSNRKKFEHRLDDLVHSGWSVENRKEVDVRNDYKTQKMAVVRTVKTLILDPDEIEKRVVNYNENALSLPSRNFEELKAKSVSKKITDRSLAKNKKVLDNPVDSFQNSYEPYEPSADSGNIDPLRNSLDSNQDSNKKVFRNYQKVQPRRSVDKKYDKRYQEKLYQDALIGYYYGKKSSSNTISYIIGIFTVLVMLLLFGVGYYALQSKVNNNILNEKIETLEQKNKYLKDSYKKSAKTKTESKKLSKGSSLNKISTSKFSSEEDYKVKTLKISSSKKTSEQTKTSKNNTKKQQQDRSKSQVQTQYRSQAQAQSKSNRSSLGSNTAVESSRRSVGTQPSGGKNSGREDKDSSRVSKPVIQKNNGLAKLSVQSSKYVDDSSKAASKPQQQIAMREASKPQQALKPSNGTLTISSRPAADIYINGSKRGTTLDQTVNSGQIKLPSGSYRIELRREGYQSYFVTIKLEGGDYKNISAQLRRIN